ncbi:MAG: DNA primase, partial [Bdellovibrionales bacterium]|nr:DNA primase [Bdellovibrionales bacterium]
DLYHRVNHWVMDQYHTRLTGLPANHFVKNYLEKRGLSESTVNQFSLGYATEDWSNIADGIIRKKLDPNIAETLGLIRKRNKGDGYFDLFRDRLMFPILSLNGDPIGFGGRILGDGEPKYLNSPETPLFQKGKVLYGLNETAKYIRSEDQAIVVEGYMDCLALYQAGIKNVVAVLGTALTSDHAKLLSRFTKNVLVLFDNDNAGQAAARKSLVPLLENGLYPKGAILSGGKDPDEIIQTQGVENFRRQLSASKDLLTLVFDQIRTANGGKTNSDLVRILDEIKPYVIATKDNRLRDLYVMEIAQRLGMDTNWLSKSLNTQRKSGEKAGLDLADRPTPGAGPDRNKVVSAGRGTNNSNFSVTKNKPIQVPREEIWLLNLALLEAAFLDSILHEDVLGYLTAPEVRQIFDIISEVYRQSPDRFDSLTALVTARISEPEMITQFVNTQVFGMKREEQEKVFKDCLRKIRERGLKARSLQLSKEIRENPEDTEKIEAYQQVLKSLRGLERQA